MKDIRPQVAEANTIAKKMGKDILFKEKFLTNFDDSALTGTTDQQDEVQVTMQNFETGAISNWSVDKFLDKLDMMRDTYSQYCMNKQAPVKAEEDPFNEKQEPMLLGVSYYVL